MASPSSSADKLPLSAVTASVASGLLAVWGLRQRQRRLVEQQQQQRQRSRSDHRNGQEPQQEPQQQQEEEEERPSSPPSSRQLRPGQRQWAALEGESPEEAEAAAPLATPSKPQRSSRRKGAEDGGPPSTPRHASSAKSRPPSTVPKLQAARDAAIEAAAAAAAAGSATAGDSSSASSTPTHHGRPPPKQGQGQQGESTAARVSRSLSEGPLPEVQERVLAALAACPGMAGVGNRRIELLVHNLSHKDMVLSLAPLSTSSKKEEAQGKPQQQQQEQQQQEAPRRMSSATSEELVLCRPKFSLFQPVSEALLGAVAGAGEGPGGEPAGTATFPVYTREEEGGWGEEGAGAVVGSMPDTVSVSSPRSESHPDRPSPPRR